jgi:hypothetical protein
LKLPYLRASYTKSVGPIKFCIEIYLPRLLFFKTLRRLGAIFILYLRIVFTVVFIVFLQFLQKLSPEKKLKGRHWKDEISALTSVSLGSSGDLLLGLQKSAVVTTFLKSAPSISLYGSCRF